MSAHPIPAYVPMPLDNFLVDEEFDMFDITPSYQERIARKPKLISHNRWLDQLDLFDEEEYS